MDVDSYSNSEEEYEYTYSDDDDTSEQNPECEDMDAISLEMETAGSLDEDSENGMTNKKRKARGRASSLASATHDHVLRDHDCGIHMMDSKDLIPMMKERIHEISEILDIPPSAACPLLRNHKWTKERLFEAFTENDIKVQEESGVYARCHHPGPTVKGNTRRCGICLEDSLTPQDMMAMPCGHEFCKGCWVGYIQSKMDDGPSCILATCPHVGCKEVITEEEVGHVAPSLLPKFESYQLRNFVEVNGTSRWCPGPGCERVAALHSSSGIFHDSDNVVACCDSCMTQFCIKCGEEPHSPLNCKSLENWKIKCNNESETANWILANTKPCPKCRSRIEKNQGCNHMTCQKCKYEFCWICCGDWKEHGANTGGYYNCNKFSEEKDTDNQSDAARAKRELDRYLHYYSRYHAHAEAQRFAKRQLVETEKRMVLLQESRDYSTWSDVEFLKSANEQLVECRRVLKYTYTFAYYLTMPPKHDSIENLDETLFNDKKDGKKMSSSVKTSTTKDSKIEYKEEESGGAPKSAQQMQKERFEYHQEMLERFTENLSELVEKPLNDIDRVMVVNQTRVVDRFMKNMLQYVEDGMEETV